MLAARGEPKNGPQKRKSQHRGKARSSSEVALKTVRRGRYSLFRHLYADSDRRSHPRVVPRSSESIASEGAARPLVGGLASAWGSVRVMEAMVVSVRGDDRGQ